MKLNKVLIFAVLITFLFSGLFAQDDIFKSIEKEIQYNQETDLDLYKYLHKNPELSFMEEKTSEIIARDLMNMGYEVSEHIGGFGIVGIMRNGPGPVIMLRTDMDALPIEEKTGLSYASTKTSILDGKNVPVMHACGHDMHMASFIGTAKVMAKFKENWQGTLFLLAQPAEERGGAKFVLDDGLFQRFPVPDAALAYHVSPNLEAGKIGYVPGPSHAKVNTLEIKVYGLGGHGARPEDAIDPIVLSAQIIMGIQTIVSREISPLESAVITVGAIHGGSKHNIIPDEVQMMLTLRSYSESVADHMIKSIKRISNGIAASAGLPEEKFPEVIEVDESLPPGINSEKLTLEIAGHLKEKMSDNIVLMKPTMGAEDFFQYSNTEEEIPVCMLRLGTVSTSAIEAHNQEGKSFPSLHSPLYAPEPELSLKTGIQAMSYTLVGLFNSKKVLVN